jgi:hypothetical protein
VGQLLQELVGYAVFARGRFPFRFNKSVERLFFAEFCIQMRRHRRVWTVICEQICVVRLDFETVVSATADFGESLQQSSEGATAFKARMHSASRGTHQHTLTPGWTLPLEISAESDEDFNDSKLNIACLAVFTIHFRFTNDAT